MKRIRRLVLAAALLAVLFYCRGASGSAVSPGLEVLREETKLVKCCVNGCRVDFTADEFASLAGGEVDYITVCSLPAAREGALKMAGVDAVKGQKISAGGIALLKFVPAQGFAGESGFTFSVGEGEAFECVIKYSETVNFAPSAVGGSFDTYKNVSVTKPLGAYDPDGDALTYVVDRYPASGTLSISGGEATYTPMRGFTGGDSFVYHVVDGYGQASGKAEAEVTVKDSRSGIYFADMREDEAHLPAILAAENDVMTYRLIGDSYYFAPEEKVSRIDFAVMLVTAAGIELPKKQHATDIFTDTAAESSAKRLYLEAAVTSGLVKTEESAFRPREAISVSDAVAMTERALEEGTAGISSAYYEDTGRPLTRKDAAVMLSCLIGQ